MQMLSGKANPFNGIVINPAVLPEDPALFEEQLAYSVATWKREGFKVAWLEVPYARSALIPVATGHGFLFHHTGETQTGERVPGADYLMLTLQLEENAYVPPFATHYIGAGGVVMTPERELLVVSEKFRRDTSRPYFKLPGGALMQGEHLAEGVVREVFEETGVRAKFEAVVCFRQWHGYRYGKSDIYFVCRLSALSRELSRDETEIDDVRWMSVDEYMESEFVSEYNRSIVRAALESPGFSTTHIDGYGDANLREFFMP